MSCVALLSCLGVEGWGPRHLLLLRRGDPAALLQRLGAAWRGAAQAMAEEPRPSHLLAALLRDPADLLPLASPLVLPLAVMPRFRHRLCSRQGDRLLHLRTWAWSQAERRWRSCGAELRLSPRLLATPPALDPHAVWPQARQARRRASSGPAAPAVPAGATEAER